MKAYTEGLHQILKKAEEISRNNNLKYVGTEVILYSILLTPKCDACEYLNKFGVTKATFYPHFRKSFRHLTVDNYTPNAFSSLYTARDISTSFKISYISTEHLLMAILTINDCYGVKILRALGVDISTLYNHVYSCVLEHAKAVKQPKQVEKPNSQPKIKNEDEIVEKYVSEQSKKILFEEPTTEKVDLKLQKPNLNALKGLGYDMTEKALLGKIDPIIGRDNEIDRVIQTLSRKTKNSPLLIGEAGVGKSAIAEGLALRISKGLVPDFLKDKVLFSLDLGSLVAGTRYRGDFEQRIKTAIDYAIGVGNIIFFIDEIHNLVGAGGSDSGNMDAAEIFKPLIARGEIMLIGATTLDEYSKFIEKDPALERRFQSILVEEPSIDATIEILRGIKSAFEAHHKVFITDEAIVSAVKLSDRYIVDRFLPDKAIDLIDEAASKKRVQITSAVTSIVSLEEKRSRLISEYEYAESKLLLDKAKEINKKIEDLNAKIEKEKINNYNKRTNTPSIYESDVRELISLWTKIPLTNITSQDTSKLLSLEDELIKRVIGQNEAIETVTKAVRRSRANLKDPNKPIGAFLFVGPTGVGKSELSKALAECVFGSKDALIRFDMSEYNDKTAVNKLIGSAPGYVGYEEEGLLTEKIRRKPYSVVLFDEIEKANNDIFDLLLQVLDEGRLTDSKGRLVSFKNSLIILTSNLGADVKQKKVSFGFGSAQDDTESTKEAVKNHFRPEFINRLDDIVVFNSLTKDNCYDIADIAVNNLIARLKENSISLTVENSAIDYIVDVSYDKEYGARPIKRAISNYIENMLSDAIISGYINRGDKISVVYNGEEMEYKKI
ncbi:MAG: ATP-dependent Clp protease ATP-binding subunit [Clostridia bacterium]|nr:ATP-dependent Clp protease ATP-binding subunit [Clostridia bacterium]